MIKQLSEEMKIEDSNKVLKWCDFGQDFDNRRCGA